MRGDATEALWFTLTCPRCGGLVSHVNGTSNGSLAVAVVRCTDRCHREWEVTVRLSAHLAR